MLQFVSKPAAKRVCLCLRQVRGVFFWSGIYWRSVAGFFGIHIIRQTISESLPTNESLVCQENTFEHFQERTKTKPQYAKCQLSFHGEAKKKIEVKNSSGSSEVMSRSHPAIPMIILLCGLGLIKTF